MDKRSSLSSIGSRKPSFFYGYIVVSAAFSILVLTYGVLYSFGVFLKPVSAEFGWTRAMTSGAYSISVFVMGLLFVVTGRFNDRFGPRIVMTACGFLFGLGCLLMSQISALWQLYLFWGVIVATGMSGGFVPMTSTVARWFVKRRGMMTGIVASGVGVGIIIMPPVASWLISSYGWRTTFIVIGTVNLILLILLAQFLKRDPSKIKQLPDGDSGVERGGLASEGAGFSLQEAIHTKQFWMACTIFFSFGFSLHVIMAHIVPHATDLEFSATTAANILAVIGGLNIVGRIGIGGVSDRLGRKSSLIISFALLAVALLWVMVAKEVWILYLFAIFFGFSTGGLTTLESPVTAEFFGLRAHGTILGTVVFSTTTGGAIGSLLAGRIFDTIGDYYLAFLVCVVLAIVSLIIVWLLKPAIRQQ